MFFENAAHAAQMIEEAGSKVLPLIAANGNSFSVAVLSLVIYDLATRQDVAKEEFLSVAAAIYDAATGDDVTGPH